MKRRAEVIFNRLACKDYREARKWYADRSTDAEAKFINAVDQAVTSIGEAPNLCSVLSGKYRWARVRKFPYVLVFYAKTDHELRVVAVAHTSRRPGYWQKRE